MQPLNESELINHVANVWVDFSHRFISDSRLINPSRSEAVKLNKRVLIEAIGHAIEDVTRMMKLHLPKENPNPDRHKYSAFIGKWIAKTRPVYIDDGREKYEESELMINAYFALFIFRSFLNFDIPKEAYINITYSFHYRDLKGEDLSLVAYSMEKITELANIIEGRTQLATTSSKSTV